MAKPKNTTPTDDGRQRDLAKIHIAKKQLGLDEQTYREMLQAVSGVASAADLCPAGRRKVLAHLSRAGFKSRKGKNTFPGRPDFAKLYGTGKLAMLQKIEAYLAEAKRPWAYVHAMAKRMCKVDRVQWCAPDQLRKIIVALEFDARRHGRFTG
jgi:phage gp16-like protein